MTGSRFLYRICVACIVLALVFGSAGISPTTAQAPALLLGASQVSSPRSLSTASQSAVASHASPLAISRVQSSYVAGTTVIELTLVNNLPQTRLPEIPPGTTVTDTVPILAGLVLTDDVNSLRAITVVDTLAAGTTLIAASDSPTQNGSTLTWRLPDLPPQASATITFSVQTPAAGSDFVALDNGAQVHAARWGQPVSGTARSSVIVPSGIAANLTQATPDADSFDQDMLWKSAQLAQDPLALFAFVRGFGFDPYKGSLRGTLWGQAGNSTDLSSLLIAMLRAAGIPARYRHGTLSTANAQTLLTSMFPAARGVAGYLPSGAALADPVNDPALIARVQDHWWVEAYLPGLGWTNLDPSFDSAQPGDIFATPGANDRIAELPDNIRHKVSIALLVEQYNQFPIGGVNLNQFTPLTMTYSTAELAAKSLSVGHIVESNTSGGAVFATVTHDYAPFFAVGGDEFLSLGDTFQDLLSNFPLSSNYTTAEWLTLTVTDPDGNRETFTRVLKDLIGLDVRLNGGTANFALPADNAPFVTPTDVYVVTFLPNAVRDAGLYARQRGGALKDNLLIAQATQIIRDQSTALPLGGLRLYPATPTPTEKAAAQSAALDIQLAYARFLSLLAYDFAQAADVDAATIEDSLRVKLYHAAPRVIINASQPNDETGTVLQTLDLRSTRAESIVYPGQSLAAGRTAQWAKGVLESYTEGQALQDATGRAPLTTARIFEAMTAQGIEPMRVTPETIR